MKLWQTQDNIEKTPCLVVVQLVWLAQEEVRGSNRTLTIGMEMNYSTFLFIRINTANGLYALPRIGNWNLFCKLVDTCEHFPKILRERSQETIIPFNHQALFSQFTTSYPTMFVLAQYLLGNFTPSYLSQRQLKHVNIVFD